MRHSPHSLLSAMIFSVTLFFCASSHMYAQTYPGQLAGPNQVNYSTACTHFVDGPGGAGSVGNDSNTGTSPTKAFKTIQHAVKTAPKNSTICVRGGEYIVIHGNNSSTIDFIKGSQTLTNYQSEQPTIKSDKLPQQSNPYNYQPLVRFSSPNNTIENFILKDIPGIGITLYAETGSLANNTIRNNYISNVATAGIHLFNSRRLPSTNIQVINNKIEYCNIDKKTGDKIYNTNNLTTGSGVDCSLIQFHGIQSSTTSNPLLIQGNDLSHSRNHAIIGDTNHGQSRGVKILNNLIHNRYIYIQAATDIQIDSNFIYHDQDFSRSGWCITYNAMEVPSGETILREKNGTIADLTGKNVHITNNAVFGCRTGIALRTDHTLSKMTDTIVKQNTIIQTHEKDDSVGITFRTGRKTFIHSKYGELSGRIKYDDAFSNVSISDNIFYKTNTSTADQDLVNGYSVTEGWFERPPKGINLIQNMWSHDPDFNLKNQIVTNPIFIGAPSGGIIMRVNSSTSPFTLLNKLKLSNSSPAIDQATSNQIDHDIFDTKRPIGAKNDLGAHESDKVHNPTQTPSPTTPNPTNTQPPTNSDSDVNQSGSANIFDVSAFFKRFGTLFGFNDIKPVVIPIFTEPSENTISNGDFSEGSNAWTFYTNGVGNLQIINQAARINLNQVGDNTQLFQHNLILKPNTTYQISFTGSADKITPISVYIQNHASPYTNVGLNYKTSLNSTSSKHTTSFTTPPTVPDDSRLRFWLVDSLEDNTINIDNIVLQEK